MVLSRTWYSLTSSTMDFRRAGHSRRSLRASAVERLDGVVVALAQGQQGACRHPAVVERSMLRCFGHQTLRRLRTRSKLRSTRASGRCRGPADLRQRGVAEAFERLPVGLGAVGDLGLAFDALVDAATLLGDLGEIADAVAGDEDGGARFLEGGVDGGMPIASRCRSGFSRELLLFRNTRGRARG